jgi:WD40 repeat protein
MAFLACDAIQQHASGSTDMILLGEAALSPLVACDDVTPLKVGGNDGRNRQWVCTAVLRGHAGWVRSVAFTVKEGSFRLVSASNDATLRVWTNTNITSSSAKGTATTSAARGVVEFGMGGWTETAVLSGHRGPVYSYGVRFPTGFCVLELPFFPHLLLGWA